ncbi:MAG: hypothetical protein OXM55_00160 [Bdellovibrionales bacterium]|nr:hypothetical protein [Bdellovibrionales bacterium]
MKKGEIRKKYSPEFKQDTIELAEKIGVSNSPSQVRYTLKEYGLRASHPRSFTRMIKSF